MMTTISLCMIAKNAAQDLERCLQSSISLVDEIIVVDTGSSDQTPAVAASYGANVLHYSWDNNFAAARNLGLAQASSDWILWLDADEELSLEANLREHLATVNGYAAPCGLLHFYGQKPEPLYSYKSTAFRLLRNRCGITFTGTIHEQPNLTHLGTAYNYDNLAPLTIRHYGYLDHYLKQKRGRNSTIIQQELLANPHDPWLLYYLAVEHCTLNNYEPALTLVNAAIMLFLNRQVLPPALLYRLKYHILLHGHQDLTGIDKAVLLYPDYVDLWFYQGLHQYKLGLVTAAIQSFTQCLTLGETNPNYLILSGTGSFLATYQLGCCHQQLGDLQSAIKYYQSSNYQDQLYPKAKQQLEQLGAI